MSAHTEMLEASPYYTAVVERYGRTLTEAVVARLARDHGFSLADLTAEGLKPRKGVYSALDVVQTLGY